MNSRRVKMQESLQKDINQEKIKKATKRWLETQKKISMHKRSDKSYSKE